MRAFRSNGCLRVASKSELNDDLVITDESDVETAVERCSYRIVQVHEAVRNAVEGKWDAPIFQRGFIWKPRQLRDLADSLYRDYPIGSRRRTAPADFTVPSFWCNALLVAPQARKSI